MARFVAECIAARRSPDVVWSGFVTTPEPYKLFGLFKRTRQRTAWTAYAGWKIPNATSAHFILENGWICWRQEYLNTTFFGRTTYQTTKLAVRDIGEIPVDDVQKVIAAFKFYFKED